MKIFKIGQVLYPPQFLSRLAKKFGELWSTNYENLRVKSYPPISTFSEDYILAPKGCCASRFLHALENDQVMLVHFPLRTDVSLTIFFSKKVKNGLQFSVLAARSSWNFATWRSAECW